MNKSSVRSANKRCGAKSRRTNWSGVFKLPVWVNELLGQFKSVAEQHSLLRDYGPITVSELGRFEISSSADYESVVHKLLVDFVVPPHAKPKPVAKSGVLKRTVNNAFRAAGLLGQFAEDIESHKVVPAFPVALEENLYVDFAYKNGVYRFAEVIDFRVSRGSLNDKFKQCCEKAVSLHKAKRRFGSDSKRLVLFSAPENYDSVIDSSLNLLNDYATSLFNADSEDDFAKFHESFIPPAIDLR